MFPQTHTYTYTHKYRVHTHINTRVHTHIIQRYIHINTYTYTYKYRIKPRMAPAELFKNFELKDENGHTLASWELECIDACIYVYVEAYMYGCKE
jgi:hypothetical protein